MLELSLRKEFQGKRLKGTAIDLAQSAKQTASEFLEITYPSSDVLVALEAIGPAQGRPVALIGERGQGKSHLLACLYHALTNPEGARAWLQSWAERLHNPKTGKIPLRSPIFVIHESLHKQSYKHLWDLVFDRHPHGVFIRGKWEGQGEKRTSVPGHALLEEMFAHTPTALILDEFQTWFDGLVDTPKDKAQTWAFNFIQNLSEVAKEHPDRLLLVVSVRNGQTDAFKQIQRVEPRLVDFKRTRARGDRLRLLLHRLFENRSNIPSNKIEKALDPHIDEFLRLKQVDSSEHEKKRREFIEAWPFAPTLMDLLEDQVLVATSAQETRDLIRILADLYKRRGDKVPVLTAADFHLEDEESGIAALLDSVANDHHAKLREKAQRNLKAVMDAVKNPADEVPHLSDLVGALWLRSLAVGNLAGAEPQDLHLDVTRWNPVDDNAFELELTTIVDNSFNIHRVGARLIFKEEENPQAKLFAHARNDRLFADGEKKGADIAMLARQVKYVLGDSEDATNKTVRVIVLGRDWTRDPWEGVADADRPERWDDRLPLVVLPEVPEKLDTSLGTFPAIGAWLKTHLTRRRNTVRFLLPKAGGANLFADRDLLVLARAILLANEWKKADTEYAALATKHQNELRAILKKRFDRFALLATWDYQSPALCTFHFEMLKEEGPKIPEAVETAVRTNLFEPEDFEAYILAAAVDNQPVSKLLAELMEPRPNGDKCIPWLGETLVKEKLIVPCAEGKIAINLRGMEYLQAREGESRDAALKRMRGRLGTGKHLEETWVLLPQSVPTTGGVVSPAATTTVGAAGTISGGTASTGGSQAGQTTATADTLPTSGDGTAIGCGSGAGNSSLVTGAVPEGSSIFGNVSSWKSYVTAGPTSSLNLLGKIETEWDINIGTRVKSVSITVDELTGAQLQKLLKSLPDGVTYGLTLEKEEG